MTKWENFLYRNYSKRRENTAFILGMVAFSVLSLPVFGRTLNIVGSLAAIIFAVLFYRAKKQYEAIVAKIQQKNEWYYQECVKHLKRLEAILDKIPYLTEKDKEWMLDELWFELRHYCLEPENYMRLLNKILYYIAYFEKRTREQQFPPKGRSGAAEYLRILGLPADTCDWNAIKSRYRQLMKKYHPDICSNPDALATTQKINHAYEELKKQFAQ